MKVMTDDARPAAASTSSGSGSAPPSVKRLPELTRAAMWWTAILIAVLTAGAVTVLWWPATAGLTGADLVKARLDALKIGLSIGVGSGGVVALYLAWRRQHSTEADLDNRERALAHQQDVAATTQSHQERVADDARADAIERRINELYLKAVEQLGSDKAPVRLGGLYALERLAENNETLRKTVAQVFCAYLRMPYEPPDEKDREDDASEERHELYRARAQEREVRLTAQGLLIDHLRPQRDTLYWGPLSLNLIGAHLTDFVLSGAHVGMSHFHRAIFAGRTYFDDTTFTGSAWFQQATFDFAVFNGATFSGGVSFLKSTFTDDLRFEEVTIKRKAVFYGVAFNGDVTFDRSNFTGETVFKGAAFNGDVTFNQATFISDPSFPEATFVRAATFDQATVKGELIHSTSEPDGSDHQAK